MKNSKGFTLVELLAVIVILGLLSSVAVVSIVKNKNSAIEKEKIALRQNVISTYNIYRIDNGSTLNKEVEIKDFNAIFTFNGEKCETVSGTIKFVYESDVIKQEVYCVKMFCNGEFIIDDYSSNSEICK